VLPDGIGYEWTGSTFQELKTGNVAGIIFGLSLLTVFLLLSALSESYLMPFVVLFAVPSSVLGAALFLKARGLSLDVYGQIGLVLLIGLAAKNAILIVEFAIKLREEGKSAVDAAAEAARLRLRPILMTSFAFILGVVPLAIATGAGAGSRVSLGTTVVGGMLIGTVLALMTVPTLFVIVEKLRGNRTPPQAPHA
jgi:multidrug efflux pump subunit AcrB